MVPGNPLTKGARYAENLESWFNEFPREQLLVIHTDDLTTSTQASPVPRRNPNPKPNPNDPHPHPHPNPHPNPHPHPTPNESVMNATFAHLGLPMVDVGRQSRFCVRGKVIPVRVGVRERVGVRVRVS